MCPAPCRGIVEERYGFWSSEQCLEHICVGTVQLAVFKCQHKSNFETVSTELLRQQNHIWMKFSFVSRLYYTVNICRPKRRWIDPTGVATGYSHFLKKKASIYLLDTTLAVRFVPFCTHLRAHNWFKFCNTLLFTLKHFNWSHVFIYHIIKERIAYAYSMPTFDY
jgi:hypothetical protein